MDQASGLGIFSDLASDHWRAASGAMSNAIARDQPQLGAVLQEDVAGRLLRVDADAVVRDDRAAGRLHAELRRERVRERERREREGLALGFQQSSSQETSWPK